MHTSANYHVNGSARVNGEILNVANCGPTMFLNIESADGGHRISIILRDPVFLDKLANEAERLCREFVGDAPDWQSPHANGEHCECGEGKPGPDEVSR